MWDSDDPVPRNELLKKVKGCDGILCVLTEKIDAEVLDAAGCFIVHVIGRKKGQPFIKKTYHRCYRFLILKEANYIF